MFYFSSDYTRAKDKKTPIVAFESAIITHGLPYPENKNLIDELISIANSYGVYLAILWLDAGYVKVGFENQELKELANRKDVVKVSSRDIPFVIEHKFTGGTTVAATLHLAHHLNLSVFATGGLGGVHRGAENSFDISNDLQVLSQVPMIVVSAGVKSILDVAKTLEMMETLGIPIYGFRTARFPLFYTRESAFKINKLENVDEIIKLFRIQKKMHLHTSMIVANPVQEKFSIPQTQIDRLIEKAIGEAELLSISGQDITPFLLKKLSESELGTVKTNLELVKNNVKLGCEIARKISL